MKSRKIRSLEEKIQKIPGWFSSQDLHIFALLLKLQSDSKIYGDLLEIGTFMGKSASVLGALKSFEENLYVCDLFNGVTDSINNLENKKSYEGLTRSSFEKNYYKVNQSLPTILEISSTNLEIALPKNIFRFIHIDGSHLYSYARSDLIFATKHLAQHGGVIVVDDFRAQHTLGVSKCVWEAILSSKLVPAIVSAAKIYLVRPGESSIDPTILKIALGNLGFETEELDLFDSPCIRLMGTNDASLYMNHNFYKQLIPPILVPLLRRTNGYFRAVRKSFR